MRDRLAALKTTVSTSYFARLLVNVMFLLSFDSSVVNNNLTCTCIIWLEWSGQIRMKFLGSNFMILQANIDDDETQDYDEPSTTINVENSFMDNFFQHVSSAYLHNKKLLALSSKHECNVVQYGNYYCLFYQSPSFKVATIRGNIDKLAQDVEQVKKMHSAMLSAAVADQGIKNNIKIGLSSWRSLFLRALKWCHQIIERLLQSTWVVQNFSFY